MSDLSDLLHTAYSEMTALREQTSGLAEKVKSMMNVFDEIKTILADVHGLADKVIGAAQAAKSDAETAAGAFKTDAEALRDKLAAFVASIENKSTTGS